MSWLKLVKPINLQSTNVGIFFRIPFALFIILYKNSVFCYRRMVGCAMKVILIAP